MFSIFGPKSFMWILTIVSWQNSFVAISQRNRQSFRLVEILLKLKLVLFRSMFYEIHNSNLYKHKYSKHSQAYFENPCLKKFSWFYMSFRGVLTFLRNPYSSLKCGNSSENRQRQCNRQQQLRGELLPINAL